MLWFVGLSGSLVQGKKCPFDCKHSEMAQHQQECKLVPVACGFEGCDSQPSKSRLANHRKQCEHRPRPCPNKCREEVTPAGLVAHQKLCPQQEIVCRFSGCGVRIFRADQAEHDEQNMPKHLSGLQQQNNTQLQEKLALEQKLQDEVQRVTHHFEKQLSAMQQQFNTQLQQLAASINAQPAAAAVDAQQVAIPAVAAGQTVRHVPGDYPTIQAGINAADVGDRVLVAAGVYTESLRITRKQVEVVGVSRESTVVQSHNVTCCAIDDASFMLANITLKASGQYSSAVMVTRQCGDITLVDCNVSSASGFGVLVPGCESGAASLQNLVLQGCRIWCCKPVGSTSASMRFS